MADALSVLKYYLYYKYRRRLKEREALERWQSEKISRHLEYVSEHSRLYKGKRSLGDYPVADKAFMMKHFNELNTVGIDREEAERFAVQAERERKFSPRLQGVTVGLSSGTSGRRGIFLVSKQEESRWAGYILAKFLPGSILQRHTIAFFMRADSNLYQSVRSKNIRFHFFDIYRDMEEHVRRLEEICPEILVGQPSVLLMLAEKKKRGAGNIQPQIVISIAEVLEKEDEKRLKDAFGLEVIHQVYQCTEGCLASTCRYGTLHLNEDIVHIEREYLDEKRFVPVVTDFERKAQPIIRYRLNDILVEKKDGCRCGSPCLALEKIEGREDDIFWFAGTNGKKVAVFPDFIRRCLLFAGGVEMKRKKEGAEAECKTEHSMEDGRGAAKKGKAGSRNFGDYRVVQQENGLIFVYADLTECEKQQVRKEFAKLAEDRAFILPDILFRPYTYERGRKMKRVEREQRRCMG